MRILVTGATGQVGRALTERLPRLGNVIATERRDLDLAQPERLEAALEGLAPDVIINSAAYTAVDKAEDEAELAFRVNGEAPGIIALWAAARNVPLLHFSTDYVFDGSGDRAWHEDDPTGPLSVYGASKLAGEEAVRAAGGPSLIVRTSWIYAATGTNFMRAVARLASAREELRIVADQIGAPTSAVVIADGVMAMLQGGMDAFTRSAMSAAHRVHLTASGEANWHEFASAIVDGLRARGASLAARTVIPIGSADYPTKARRPRNSRLSLERLRGTFGIVTPHWADALQPELDLLARELVSAQRPSGLE